MSNDLENNKILSAILVAGIVAMLSGFIASKIVHPETPEKAALDIDTSALETASSAGGAPAGPEPILALLATADVAKGEALAKACTACHGFDKGGANKVGPNLYGIVNGPKAHRSDFAYSDAIKEMGAKGEKWTYQNLGAFLWKPAAYAKGTKMSFPGLKKPQDRANVIAYLRTLSDSPAALPSDAEIAAEAPKDEPKETTVGTAAESSGDEAKGEKPTSGKENPALKSEAAAPAQNNSSATAAEKNPEEKPMSNKPASEKHAEEKTASEKTETEKPAPVQPPINP